MQQINLYQPILRKQEKVFSLKALLQGNLVILVALLLIYLVTLYQSQSLSSQYTEMQGDLAERSKTLVELQRQFPARDKSQNIVDQLERARAQLAHKRRLLNELRQQNTGADGNPGFSEQLGGLARQDVENIWLGRISVRDGKQLTLHGWATAPEEIPRLIQRLVNEPSFSGTRFTQVQISRETEPTAVIAFRLETTEDNGEGGQ